LEQYEYAPPIILGNRDYVVDAAELILVWDHSSAERSLEISTEREAFLFRELVRFLYEEDPVGGHRAALIP
jgi:hypothetical protein